MTNISLPSIQSHSHTVTVLSGPNCVRLTVFALLLVPTGRTAHNIRACTTCVGYCAMRRDYLLSCRGI